LDDLHASNDSIAIVNAPAAARIARELLTATEVVEYLRLDTDGRNSLERLRNLIRRHGLPVIRRGGLRLFRRSELDLWLDAERRKPRRLIPAARN
jgi:hypothetical protein